MNTMPKGHKYRIDLHEVFEWTMTTMGPVLQLLNNQVENLHHPRKTDGWYVRDEVCTTFNETHKGEEKRYLYWGRFMKINPDSAEVKWDGAEEVVRTKRPPVFALKNPPFCTKKPPTLKCTKPPPPPNCTKKPRGVFGWGFFKYISGVYLVHFGGLFSTLGGHFFVHLGVFFKYI